MNLSDLVHRTTTGDTKNLTTTNANSTSTSTHHDNNTLFQQTLIDPSSSPSNVFLTRQDPSFLFSLPNTDWMNNHLFLNDNNSIIDSISPNPPENTVQQPLLKQTQFSQDNTESTTTNPPHQYRPIFHKFQSDSSTQVLFPVANPKHENQNLINKAAQVAIKVAAEAAAAAAAAAAATTTTSKTEIIANNESTPTSLNTNHHSLTKGKITGENVTAENIEEGYIQFVTRHDPNYISDDIESLVYAKRKFNSVPKTGDLCYTTWDVYQLVLKLHQKEIKNWSQLVGQLGLADMAGRPQFAQRVKRWMHKYKIDCYFDYLLGNEYQYFAPDNKYSYCLLIGNYKKRKKNMTLTTMADHHHHHHHHHHHSDDEEDIEEVEDEDRRIPILLAGSRKRMRDHSQNSIQMIENAQKFLRSSHDSDTGSENEFNDKKRQKYLDKVEDDHENRIQKDEEEETHVGGGEGGKEDKGEEMVIVAEEEKGEEEEEEQEEEEEDENEDEEEQEEVEIDDEEDELASSASSPSSPTRIMLPSPKLAVVKDKQISSPIIPNTTDSPQQQSPSCSNCKNNELKMTLMKHEMDRLKAQISQLERQCYKQNNQINKLLRLRDRTERWRKQIISDLARGPLIVSDDDDDEDEDEEDEDEDDD